MAIGDDRELEFQLFRRRNRGDKGKRHVKVKCEKSNVVFDMKHGNLISYITKMSKICSDQLLVRISGLFYAQK